MVDIGKLAAAVKALPDLGGEEEDFWDQLAGGIESLTDIVDARVDVSSLDLSEALHAADESASWPDDVTVSREQAIMCWKLVEVVRAVGWPERLRV